MKIKAWTVRLGNFAPFAVPHKEKPIRQDIVFYSADMDSEAVKRSLIEHDGYPENIKVYRRF